jgi:hypothetical protein
MPFTTLLCKIAEQSGKGMICMASMGAGVGVCRCVGTEVFETAQYGYPSESMIQLNVTSRRFESRARVKDPGRC